MAAAAAASTHGGSSTTNGYVPRIFKQKSDKTKSMVDSSSVAPSYMHQPMELLLHGQHKLEEKLEKLVIMVGNLHDTMAVPTCPPKLPIDGESSPAPPSAPPPWCVEDAHVTEFDWKTPTIKETGLYSGPGVVEESPRQSVMDPTPVAREQVSAARRSTVQTGRSRQSRFSSVPMQYAAMDDVQAKLMRAEVLYQHKCAEKVWQLLEDPESSKAAGIYARCVCIFVVATAAITLIYSTDTPLLRNGTTMVMEVVFETIFGLEMTVRFAVTPNRRRFFRNFHNCVDLLVSFVPLSIRALIGFDLNEDKYPVAWFFLVAVTPVLRLLKTLRHFDTFKLLISAFQLAAEALPALIFTLAVMTLSFAAIIYAVEPRSNIPHLSNGIWLVIVTTTTVGYGDTLPTSTAATCVVAVLIICSVLYFAVPLGMVGHSFTVIWADRDKILLLQHTRERLRDWGYDAHDVPTLFRHFDTDGNGQLDLREFSKMVKHMGLRISAERRLKLFEVFDQDNSGIVDDVEFVRIMYPDSYHQIYDLKRTTQRRKFGSMDSVGDLVR